jgi:predicted ATP-dependent Lon-type protease
VQDHGIVVWYDPEQASGNVAKDNLAELVKLALEGRRRVKEQLKKIGPLSTTRPHFRILTTTSGTSAMLAYQKRVGVILSLLTLLLLVRSIQHQWMITAKLVYIVWKWGVQ